VQFNTYSAAGALIAADLVNEPPGIPSQLAALLERYLVHQPAVDEAAMAELRRWESRLRTVFESAGAEQAAAAGALLTDADCRPRLVCHDGLAHHLHYAPLDADIATRVRALTAAGLAQLIADGSGGRLGCCAREGCGQVFVDTSRNGRRAFCAVRCANVVNVQRHRARHRPGRPATAGSVRE
jgi:predicted RNA-binding Zn ribbon-like protein